LLLGEGADELFGGYSWFGLSQLPFWLMPARIRSAIYYYALSRNVTFHPSRYYTFWCELLNQTGAGDIFNQIATLELTQQLPNHLLMKVDKATMASSVEARVPYLDHRVVEFVYSLPREYKLRGDWADLRRPREKYILRQIAFSYLPPQTAFQKKRGFMLPNREVLNADISKVRDYVTSSGSLASRLLSRRRIASLFVSTGIPLLDMEREYLLWRIFLLEVWNKTYVEYQGPR